MPAAVKAELARCPKTAFCEVTATFHADGQKSDVIEMLRTLFVIQPGLKTLDTSKRCSRIAANNLIPRRGKNASSISSSISPRNYCP